MVAKQVYPGQVFLLIEISKMQFISGGMVI